MQADSAANSPTFAPPKGARFYCYGVRIPYFLWRLIYGPLRFIENGEAKFYVR